MFTKYKELLKEFKVNRGDIYEINRIPKYRHIVIRDSDNNWMNLYFSKTQVIIHCSYNDFTFYNRVDEF